MTVTRNTGADLLPFGQPPHPGARLRAVQNARARREREAPPPDAAYTAERPRRDLASLPREVVLQDRTNGTDAATATTCGGRGGPPTGSPPHRPSCAGT